MPKPAHSKVTFEGVIGSSIAPLERWSFSIGFPADAIPVDGSQVVDDAVAHECAAAYNTNVRPQMPSDVVLTTTKVAHILGTGHYALRGDGSYVQGTWTEDIAGPNPPLQVPLQTALCVSLMTNRAGPTGKGRFFLPWPAHNIDAATKRLTEANAGDVAGLAAGLLDDLATIFTFAPQVVSSKGYMSEVISVRVGRAPDTMRSRREDLPEGYVTAPLA